MKCYRKNGSDALFLARYDQLVPPSMKCYRKNGSDGAEEYNPTLRIPPSMKCYRKNGSDNSRPAYHGADSHPALNEVLPKER